MRLKSLLDNNADLKKIDLKTKSCFVLNWSKLTSIPLSNCYSGRGDRFCEGNKGFFSSRV